MGSGLVSLVAIGALAFLAFVGGPVLAWFQVLPPIGGFGLFTLGGMIGAVAVVLGIIALFFGKTTPGAITVILGGIPAVVLILGFISGLKVPRSTTSLPT